eukprot:TRINITY_DN21684_c0_g1_i1.p1 TRINITY_DN21684_c0_g1~~TRINITY_DN21684_c0_g1_i1.p1  ORF type:complete len:677 (-),score=108.76 TRINITY_DN21684_c0_g1_i1:368-2347(-)
MAGAVARSSDPSTLSEPLGPGRLRVIHFDLDVTVDFVGKRLLGHVDLRCRRNDTAPENGEGWELVLDAARNLLIKEVEFGGSALDRSQWNRDDGRKSDVLGEAIRVRLPAGPVSETLVVRVVFETAAPSDDAEGGSSALMWLSPAQTAGKVFPYMYSQCQAIHARAMFPCQDTCEIKATYTATVLCPTELSVLMSAVKTGGPVPAEQPEWETPVGCGKGWSRHSFEQSIPIPAYLVAIVCAALESRRVGPRSHVWSEKEMVDACAWEFEDTEKFIASAEALCGPYRWGIYDLLVLPPSFPYGGMENPCLTFVTPTLLAKDRSQVSVIAHEIAHSWSGNLVTNETWEHFWLNEGLTVFTELKIIRDVYGAEEASLQLSNRLKYLDGAISRFGKDHNFTRLVPSLGGGLDPDDAFSPVPYVKGMSLFCRLESIVGEDRFQPFLRSYFEHFAERTVTSQQMRDYFLEYFTTKAAEDQEVKAAMNGPIAALDWEQIWHAPGMPEFVPHCDAAGPMGAAKALAESWCNAVDNEEELSKFSEKDIENWTTTKLILFLDILQGDIERGGGRFSAKACSRMAESYNFLDSNCEVRFRFLQIALSAKWDGARIPAVNLAVTQGRMKFTRPMFRALKEYDHALATEAFNGHRACFHPICSKMVARDLDI